MPVCCLLVIFHLNVKHLFNKYIPWPHGVRNACINMPMTACRSKFFSPFVRTAVILYQLMPTCSAVLTALFFFYYYNTLAHWGEMKFMEYLVDSHVECGMLNINCGRRTAHTCHDQIWITHSSNTQEVRG